MPKNTTSKHWSKRPFNDSDTLLGWAELYTVALPSVVCTDLPQPDFEVGCEYEISDKNPIGAAINFKELWQRSTPDTRYFKILAYNPNWEYSHIYCDTCNIRVVQEHSYDEILQTKQVAADIDGNIYYTKGFAFYRDDKDEDGMTPPVVVKADGTKEWRNAKGRLHRDEVGIGDHADHKLPAVIRANGDEEYWKNGVRIIQGDTRTPCTKKTGSVVTWLKIKF